MDIASVAGMIIALVAMVVGTLAAGLGAADIIDIPSIFITVFGSFATVLISNPLKLTLRIPTIYRKIFEVQNFDIAELIQRIVSFSEKARREGLLALEDDMESLDDEFLRKALQLVVDGTDPEIVRNVMQIELDAMEERHAKNRAWFDSLSALAPAFGMLGTLIGLVGMLRNLGGDASAIGRGMAAALITTLYGSFISNVIAIPTSNKLKSHTEAEVLIKQIMIEGTLSIQAGDNPRIVQEKLASYLPPEDRDKLKQEEE
ncbi:MAG: motility protein A [Candidatus Hydrogenedentota bacterium]|nr:MAG: motility protein A [Candidatus Hydrogenedentota bacterium]